MKSTKGRRSRLVPLADRVLDIVADLSVGKGSTDLLCTTDQATALHRTAVVRTLAWEKTAGGGRRIHDLRHTAACLWLSRRWAAVDYRFGAEWWLRRLADGPRRA